VSPTYTCTPPAPVDTAQGTYWTCLDCSATWRLARGGRPRLWPARQAAVGEWRLEGAPFVTLKWAPP
jgi:hypothetical protein